MAHRFSSGGPKTGSDTAQEIDSSTPISDEEGEILWCCVQRLGISIWNGREDSPLTAEEGQAPWLPIKNLLAACVGVGEWNPDFVALVGEGGEVGPAALEALEHYEAGSD